MNAGVLRFSLRLYIYAAAFLILLSLGGLTETASVLIRLLSGPALAVFFLLRMRRQSGPFPHLLFPWFAAFIIWLTIQQAGIWLTLPFFKLPPDWKQWQDLFGLMFCGMVFYLCTEEAFQDRSSLARFLKTFTALSALTAVYFIYIFYTSGVRVEKIKGPFPVLEYLGDLAPVSFQPNNLVDIFIPGFFFCLSMIFYNHRRKLNHPDPAQAYTEVFLYLCYTCVLLAAILFTQSRAGILSFLISLGLYFTLFTYTHRRRRGAFKLVMLIFAVGLFFLCSLGLKQVVAELGTIKETVGAEMQIKGLRSLTIGASWQLVKEHGLFGVGLGNFQMAWVYFHQAPFLTFPSRSYNDLLWFWAEAGAPGVLALSGVFLVFWFAGAATAIRTQSCFVSYLLTAALASLTAFITHSMVDPTFYVEALFWEIAIVFGIGGACYFLEKAETFEEKGEKPRAYFSGKRLLTGLFLLALGGLVSWNAFQKFLADQTVRTGLDVTRLEKAVALDRYNPVYPGQLAFQYYGRFQKDGNAEDLNEAVRAMEEAIRRDPMNLSFYRKKADMLLDGGDREGAHKSIRQIEERLPGFYLAELTQTAFYLDAAVRTPDPEVAGRFKTLALSHYNKALELNPTLTRERDLYPHVSLDGRKLLKALMDPGKRSD